MKHNRFSKGFRLGTFSGEKRKSVLLMSFSAFVLQKEAQNKQTGNTLLINYIMKLKAICM